VDALFHQLDMQVQGPSITGGKWRYRRAGSKSAVNAPQGVFRSPDGWIVVHVMERQWPAFCRAVGLDALLDDPRFLQLKDRSKRIAELNEMVQARFLEFASDDDLHQALDAERVPFAPVIDPADAHEHPYFQERGLVRSVADPVLGEVAIPGMPLRFSAQPDLPELAAPRLGEHNRDVLSGLGYDAAAIDGLEAGGVLHEGPT
jgi:formyl-CoA transferase